MTRRGSQRWYFPSNRQRITRQIKATNVVAAGGVSLTPMAMTNIHPSSVLVLDSGASQETVVVAAATATDFTTTTTLPHNGTATPFAIVSEPSLSLALAGLAAVGEQAVAPFFATYPELSHSIPPM